MGKKNSLFGSRKVRNDSGPHESGWEARQGHAIVTVVAIALVSLLGSCAGNTPTSVDGTGESVPRPEATESITQDWPAPDQSDYPLPSDSGDLVQPSDEIWQWALGRSIWDDEALAGLAATMGPASDSIMMQPYGFQLDVDVSGIVTAALLFNDEVALGLPASESSFSAYQGALPGGLSWDDTYDTVVGRYGQGALVTGGWGVPFSFAYPAEDGNTIELTFLASHADELPGAPLHIVTVRAP